MDIIAVDSVSLCLNTEKPTLMYSCDIFLLAVEMKPITIQQSRLTTTSWWVHNIVIAHSSSRKREMIARFQRTSVQVRCK